MTTATSQPNIAVVSRRFSIPVPRPLWIGMAGGAILVLALGVRFSWPIWRQHLVVSQTERWGGRVHYGDKGPEFLRRWLGDERVTAFCALDWIVIDDAPADDAFLSLVGGITSLRHLDLRNTAITDTGMRRLSSLTNLLTLDLSGTRITDSGMQHIRGLKDLVQLRIDRTGVTDDGLKHLNAMTELTELHLSGPNITDAGLMHLKSLPVLHDLYLDDTKVTGLGILDLKRVNRGLWVR